LEIEEGAAMSDAIKDANLELMIGLNQHLEHAARLRTLLDRLLTLAAHARTHGTSASEASVVRDAQCSAKGAADVR
jgi:hypothetical protein